MSSSPFTARPAHCAARSAETAPLRERNRYRIMALVVIMAVGFVALGLAHPADASTQVPSYVAAAADTGRAVWVFLSEKGPSEYTAKLSSRQFLTDRALRRIALRGGAYSPEQDWPVYSEYTRALVDAGLAIRFESRLVNAVSGTATAAVLEQIAQFKFVDSIRLVMLYRKSIPDDVETPAVRKPGTQSQTSVFDYGNAFAQIEAIQVDRVHETGLDGHGVFLCFLDTGFDTAHPAFDSLRLIATHDFINGDDDVGDSNISQMGHGTATLSCAAALDPGHLIGVAPRADYALGKTEEAGMEEPIEEDYWVAGAEWADMLGCDIISSSVGYSIDWLTVDSLDGNTAVTTIEADLLAARGVLTVNSAGNEGGGNNAWQKVIAPADGDSVLAVGATELDGRRASFSSMGPTADGRIKPDVMAPGSNVVGANAMTTTYSLKTGTSFSAPLAAGVCALMLENDSTMTPWEIIEQLRATATMSSDPDTLMGWGIIRAADAIEIPKVVAESGVRAYPNPSRDGQFTIVSQDSTGTFWVYTVSGQNVQTGTITEGSGRWDGRNSDGQPVASGIYLIRVVTPVREDVIKVAILRAQ